MKKICYPIFFRLLQDTAHGDDLNKANYLEPTRPKVRTVAVVSKKTPFSKNLHLPLRLRH